MTESTISSKTYYDDVNETAAEAAAAATSSTSSVLSPVNSSSSVVPWNDTFFREIYKGIVDIPRVFDAMRTLSRLEPSGESIRTLANKLHPDSPLLPLVVPFVRSHISMLERLRILKRSMHIARVARYHRPKLTSSTDSYAYTTTSSSSTCGTSNEQQGRGILTIDAGSAIECAAITNDTDDGLSSSSSSIDREKRQPRITRDEYRLIRDIAKESRDHRDFANASLAQQRERVNDLRARLDRTRHIVDMENVMSDLIARIDNLQVQQANQTLSMAVNLQIEDIRATMIRNDERHKESHELRMRAKLERKRELERAIAQLEHIDAETRRFGNDFATVLRRMRYVITRDLQENVSRVHSLCVDGEKKCESTRRDWPRALIAEIARDVNANKIITRFQRTQQLQELEDYVRSVQGNGSGGSSSGSNCLADGESSVRVKTSSSSSISPSSSLSTPLPCNMTVSSSATMDTFMRPIDCADVIRVHAEYCDERAAIARTLKPSRYTALTEANETRSFGVISKEDHRRVLEIERLIGYLHSNGTKTLTESMLRAYNIGHPFDEKTMKHHVIAHLDPVNSAISRDLQTMDARFGLIPLELGRFLVSLFAVRYDDDYADDEPIVSYMDGRSRLKKFSSNPRAK